MKALLSFFFVLIITTSFAQENDRISTMDFVQVLDSNRAETLFYYQNNWEVLRKSAIGKNYIDSYQLIETPYTDDGPYHFILITTYSNQQQFDEREQNFKKLIEEKGGRKLLNGKQPKDFRRILYSKKMVKHWN